MCNLLYKELRLAAHPTLYIFTLLGALVLVPAYPYGVVFMFGCLAPYITFMYGRETNDVYFTALLPVKKRDVVKSKCALMVFTQMAQLIVSLPFAFLRLLLLPQGNPVGIEANVAYYGFGFMIFAIFNFIFLTQFFKTAYKIGKAFLLALLPVILGIVAMEGIVHVPGFAWLDSVEFAMQLRQLPILLFGVVLYFASIMAGYSIGAKRFEKVDL